MAEYLHGTHSVFLIHLHIVWIMKKRKKIFTGDIALKIREIISKICAKESINIIRWHVSTENVYIFLLIRLNATINK
jgi:putative transposase